MPTKYSQHNQKIKKLKEKIRAIEKKHPTFSFYDCSLLRDIDKHRELVQKLILAEVNIKACKSDDPDYMCKNCTCWKSARAACS